MTNQIFVSKIGFDKKGYNLIEKSDKTFLVVSGTSIDYSEKIQVLKKKCQNIIHIPINKERNSIQKIEKLADSLKAENIENIICFGGGSIIDTTKLIYLSLKNNCSNLNFYVIPTMIGSGAESSITSVINTKDKKIIATNELYLPATVIYDTDIISNISINNIIFGSIDALTHCFESMTSFLSNPYLKFFSNQTISYFFSEFDYRELLNKNKLSQREIIAMCSISFNGGLAQSNAGAGICHAFAHAAEEITSIRHSNCIAYFLDHVLEDIKENNSSFIEEHNIIEYDNLLAYSKSLKDRIDNIDMLKELHSSEDKKNSLIEIAKKDPCWRLFNLKGNKNNII